MGAVENIKEVADLIKKYNDIDLNRRILELETEVIDLTREKRRADDRIEELEKAFKFKGEMNFKDPYCWIEGDESPYCPACWNENRVVAHIVKFREPMRVAKQMCPICKNVYGYGERFQQAPG